MSETLTVAVAQCPGNLEGRNARLAWIAGTLAGPMHPKPDLMILPELFQCGYNCGDDIPARAESSDGPFAQAMAALAQQHGIALLYGYAETEGDRLFNAAQCIDRTGTVIGTHRKLMLPPGFEGEIFTPGEGVALFQLGAFRIAILVCYDVEFPETLRQAATLGADLVAVPTALSARWGVVSDHLVATRAFENGLYLAYANYCGRENGLAYYGGSCIVAPDGTDMARAAGIQGVLVATLDRAAVAATRSRLPYLRDSAQLMQT